MNYTTKRSLLRSLHILFSIPILGYIYSPLDQLPNYAPIVRSIALPLIVLSGFWMWIASAPKKSILVPLGVLLILLGIVAPLPLTPPPPTPLAHPIPRHQSLPPLLLHRNRHHPPRHPPQPHPEKQNDARFHRLAAWACPAHSPSPRGERAGMRGNPGKPTP